MNKIEKKNIQKTIMNQLQSFYTEQDFRIGKNGFEFEKDGFSIFWNIESQYYDSVVFRPWLMVDNPKIKEVLYGLFQGGYRAYSLCKAIQLEFFLEMGIYDYGSDYFVETEHPSYKVLGINGDEKEMPATRNWNFKGYDIYLDTDLEPIIEDHKYFMTKVGFPFFEKVDTLEKIHHWVNDRVLFGTRDEFYSNERKEKYFKLFNTRETHSGMIAAYFTQPEVFEECVERYKIMFGEFPYVMGQLEQLYNHLKENY